MREPYSEVERREGEEEEGALRSCENLTRGEGKRGRGERALKLGARTLREAAAGERATRGAEDNTRKEEDGGAAKGEAASRIVHG